MFTNKKNIIERLNYVLNPVKHSPSLRENTKLSLFKCLDDDPDYKPYEITGEKEVHWNLPYQFPPVGNEKPQYRPQCINPGCIEPVGYTSTTITGLKILRTVCNSCHVNGYKGLPLGDGIEVFKKNYCENIDGRLGYKCTATIQFGGQLELDHINGNHYMNFTWNVQTLCKNCHSYKSYINGDCR